MTENVNVIHQLRRLTAQLQGSDFVVMSELPKSPAQFAVQTIVMTPTGIYAPGVNDTGKEDYVEMFNSEEFVEMGLGNFLGQAQDNKTPFPIKSRLSYEERQKLNSAFILKAQEMGSDPTESPKPLGDFEEFINDPLLMDAIANAPNSPAGKYLLQFQKITQSLNQILVYGQKADNLNVAKETQQLLDALKILMKQGESLRQVSANTASPQEIRLLELHEKMLEDVETYISKKIEAMETKRQEIKSGWLSRFAYSVVNLAANLEKISEDLAEICNPQTIAAERKSTQAWLQKAREPRETQSPVLSEMKSSQERENSHGVNAEYLRTTFSKTDDLEEYKVLDKKREEYDKKIQMHQSNLSDLKNEMVKAGKEQGELKKRVGEILELMEKFSNTQELGKEETAELMDGLRTELQENSARQEELRVMIPEIGKKIEKEESLLKRFEEDKQSCLEEETDIKSQVEDRVARQVRGNSLDSDDDSLDGDVTKVEQLEDRPSSVRDFMIKKLDARTTFSVSRSSTPLTTLVPRSLVQFLSKEIERMEDKTSLKNLGVWAVGGVEAHQKKVQDMRALVTELGNGTVSRDLMTRIESTLRQQRDGSNSLTTRAMENFKKLQNEDTEIQQFLKTNSPG